MRERNVGNSQKETPYKKEKQQQQQTHPPPNNYNNLYWKLSRIKLLWRIFIWIKQQKQKIATINSWNKKKNKKKPRLL